MKAQQQTIIPIVSAEAILLFEQLCEIEHDDVVSYDSLARTVQLDHTTLRFKQALRSARRKIQRERGVLFVVDRGTGIKRATASELVSVGVADVRHIARHSKRAVARQAIAASKVRDMTPVERATHEASTAVLGAVATMAAQTTKEIKRTREAQSAMLPIVPKV